MIAIYVFIAVTSTILLYFRVAYLIVHRPADSFWDFLRRSLPPGASTFLKLADLAGKIYFGYLAFQLICYLWRRF